MPIILTLLFLLQTASIEDVLPRVQATASNFFSALPDFLCNEDATSTFASNGKLEKETRIQSTFRGVQAKSKGYSFTETRETQTINGQPAAKDEIVKDAFTFAGGFSSVLHETFAIENTGLQTFRIAGTDSVEGKKAIVIEFETRDGEKALAIGWRGKKVVTKETGKAWIDPQTMQVLRLERKYWNLPPAVTVLTVAVNYANVEIGGKMYLMPKTVRAESARANGKKSELRIYTATYTQYRKFNVSSGVRF